jgi:hypothetical protein
VSKHVHVHSLLDEFDQFVDAFGLVDLIDQLTLRRAHRLLNGTCTLLSDPVDVNEQHVAPKTFPLSDFGVGNAFLTGCVGTALRNHAV